MPALLCYSINMSTPHIAAQVGEIAENVLLPGDPLRAKFVAEHFLDNPRQYNNIRGMLGFTGSYKGVPVSVQGSGMGVPSLLIYVTELITHYKAQRLIRIGSCGSTQEHIGVNDIIIAMSASTNNGINRERFNGADFAACADFQLFDCAVHFCKGKDIAFHAGNILTEDEFYDDDPQAWKLWAAYGVLALEMESNGLYTIAAKHSVQALSILTVSDSLLNHHELPPRDREQSFTTMMEIALETIKATAG